MYSAIAVTTDAQPTKYAVKNITGKTSNADHSRVIIHIDIDCFYAQVEMIRDPSLKDKPLGKALLYC